MPTRTYTALIVTGICSLALSARTAGQGGGSTPAPCAWAVGGDTVSLTSTTKCCADSGCTGVYNQRILGEWCMGGSVLKDCDCTQVPTTLYQYSGGTCVGEDCPTTQGNCLFGELITSIPSSYPDCGGQACTSMG